MFYPLPPLGPVASLVLPAPFLSVFHPLGLGCNWVAKGHPLTHLVRVGRVHGDESFVYHVSALYWAGSASLTFYWTWSVVSFWTPHFQRSCFCSTVGPCPAHAKPCLPPCLRLPSVRTEAQPCLHLGRFLHRVEGMSHIPLSSYPSSFCPFCEHFHPLCLWY